MSKTFLLFLVILCEGYIVLACELLAIRQLIPFVGSGTECVAIVISGVLLPLAVGYHAGGGAFKNSFARHKRRGKRALSIRKILLKNILIALAVFSVGLSYHMLEVFFGSLEKIGIHHRLAQAAVYSALFLVTPIFLLGQTVPLISNYFSRQRLSSITGRMLFFSTTGSFLGSVFSTVVLMSTIGVHNTVIVTLGLLFLLCFILAKDKLGIEVVVGVMLIVFVYQLNDYKPRTNYKIVSDNAYNIIAIKDLPKENVTYFMMNRSYSSSVAKDPRNRAEYVKYIEHNFINALPRKDSEPKEILVLGAGGFTLGLYDTFHHYTFVDIDKDLKNVAEKYLHKSKLTPNKDFLVSSARAFVRKSDIKYDIIVLDTYTNSLAIAMETITREYLLDIKKMLKDDGVLISNVICSPTFEDMFSVRYDNTFSSVFPRHSRQVIYPADLNWHKSEYSNVLYIYYHNRFSEETGVYTDDKNTYSMDMK